MGWDDLKTLAEKLGDTANAIGEVAYHLSSWNPKTQT